MNQKRILLDGFNLGLEAGTGVATYARNLSYCVHALGHHVDILYGNRSAPGSQKLLQEIAFFDTPTEPPSRLKVTTRYLRDAMRLGSSATCRPVPITGNVIARAYESRMPYFDTIWNSADIFGRADRQFNMSDRFHPLHLRARLHQETPHLAHWTYPLPMRIPGAKNIYTLHDLVPLRLPYTTLDHKRHYFNLVRSLIRRADHIVTVSETSKRDIINLLGAREDQVTNTYQAVEIPAKYANKPEELVVREIEGTFNVRFKEYFLFFGAIEPKKNVGRIIQSYLGSKVDTPLIVVGKLAWKSEQEMRLMEAVSELKSASFSDGGFRGVFHVDYSPFPLLVSLIRGAKAVIFPSLYEGFGLPVLEAMQLGTPVLTSNDGALLEIAADNALLVDPYDTVAIAEGIAVLDRNAELRGTLSRKGLERAAQFSTETYTRRLGELYDRLLASPR